MNGLINALSVALTILFGLLLVYALVMMIVPQLITSVTTLYYTAQANITKFMNWANHLEFIEKNEQITELLNSAYAALNTNLDTWNTWLKNTLLPSMQNIVSGAAIGVLNVVTVAKNLIIGIIVAVYMLASRKRFVQQGKLVLHSIVRPRWAQLITEEVKYADKMFGGFINGKIMDSAIIGVLCSSSSRAPSRRCGSCCSCWFCSSWTATSSDLKFWATPPAFPASGYCSPSCCLAACGALWA